MFLKLTQNNATSFWNPNCGVESVNGINEYIIRNSVEKFRVLQSVYYQLTKVLKLIEGYVCTIWNRLESVFRLLKKFRGIFRGRFRVFQIVSFKVKRRSDVSQIDTE